MNDIQSKEELQQEKIQQKNLKKEVPSLAEEGLHPPSSSYVSLNTTKDNPHSAEENLFKEITEEDFSKRYDTRKIYLGIQRHLFLIGCCIILSAALGTFAAWYYMTHFTAESVVLYQEDLPKTLPGNIAMNNMSLATALDLITLPTHFQAIKTILGLNLTTKQIARLVDIPTPRNNSHFLRITVKSNNPHLSIDIANTLAQVAVKSSVDFTQRQLHAELDNFKNQLSNSTQILSSKLKEIEDFKKMHQYLEMTADYVSLISELLEARSKLETANLHYNSLVVEYENLKRNISSLPAEIESTATSSNSPLGNPLHARINTVEATLLEAKTRLTAENPKVKVLESELKDLKERIKNPKDKEADAYNTRNFNKDRLSLELIRMQGKVRSAQKIKEDLTIALAEKEKKLENLPQEQIAFAKLLSAQKITEEQVQFLSKSIETLQLMLNVPQGSLEVYQLAEKSTNLKENWWVPLLPLLGLVVGLFMGLSCAAALEMRDKKLWTLRQIKLNYTIPPLMIIPELQRLNPKNSKARLLFFIRILADKLERLSDGLSSLSSEGVHKGLIVALTSSTKGEGKSCLAYHLALYYQRVGKKVLLLDLDEEVNEYSDATKTLSLEQFFQANWQHLISKGKPDCLKANHYQPFMKELIKSKQMTLLLDSIKKEYDLILIDCPGILTKDFATNLAFLADLCLFIIGSSVLDKSLIDQSLKEMQQFGLKPAGILLNRVLPIYIEDEKIKQGISQNKLSFWDRLKFWH